MTLNLNVKNYRPMNLWSYILKRMLLMIPTLLGVIAITFAVIQFVPGGPVEQMVSQLQGRDSGGEAAAVAGAGYRGRQGVDAARCLQEIREYNKAVRTDASMDDVRAKIATMSLRQFTSAAKGLSRDTTIWARFVQPSALVWQANEEARAEVTQALCAAAVTAGRLAAVVGPARGTANDYWRALFRATYKAEFRVEKPGRENSILEVNAEHLDGLLPIAWNAGGMRFKRMNGLFEPLPNSAERRRVLKWWSRRARLCKPLNLLRLAKATTTFDGAADYAAWKLQRHTGIALEVTPFRARHPLLAAPGALVELWRKRRA